MGWFIPEKAEWLAVYLHEMTTFPSSKFDDQADSTSQALDWIKKGHVVYGLIEYIKQQAALHQAHPEVVLGSRRVALSNMDRFFR